MKKYRIRQGSIADIGVKAGRVIALATLITGMVLFASCGTDKEAEVPVIEEVEITTDNYTYDVPLSSELQLYITNTCEDYNIDPALVIAMIGVESSYNADAVGDGGDSIGLMQVQPHQHAERMERLGVTDLKNPYENVTVGIDIIAEKIRGYDTIGEALTAYNAGDTGAYNLYFSKGVYANEYAKKVMVEAYELTYERNYGYVLQ